MPTVTINDTYGNGAIANAKIGLAASGAASLQTSTFYVVTDAFNIYKCLDNSNGAVSTFDPSTIGTPTQQGSFETADGYKWRYITSISLDKIDPSVKPTQYMISWSVTNAFTRIDLRILIIYCKRLTKQELRYQQQYQPNPMLLPFLQLEVHQYSLPNDLLRLELIR